MTSTTPCITVLMPVYNADRYLREAMDSILNQTFGDFEFLIIDDGSTDSSAAIVQSYSDPRIRFVRNEKNLGITATLNKGIHLASCELIARMDADDISYPDRLAKQYHFFEKHPNCVLLSNAVRYISADGKKTRNVYFNNDFIYYDLIFTCKINHSVVMYKKSVLLNEGGYLLPYAEDFNLWWRISRRYEFFHDNEILLDYRYTDSSLWKVSKKNEYDFAEYEQIVSNIKYYAGDRVVFTYDEVDFLRKDLKPLLIKNGPVFLANCFCKLDALNKCVLEKEKAGQRAECIRAAAMEKRRERIKNLRRYMRRSQIIALLLKLNYWEALFDELKRPIVKRLVRS
jgi:glycosyltransferase involved in cell wall biosynthesis